jgi:hypothetical protein
MRTATDNKDIWMYVGRFMWGFGEVEAAVNQIFAELLGGDWSDLTWLLLGNLDFRKKLTIIKIIFENQQAAQLSEFRMICNKIHMLHDIRNVIAHSAFVNDSKDSIIFFTYVDRQGRTGTPNSVITYSAFDRYNDVATECSSYLDRIHGSLTPVIGLQDDALKAIAQVVNSTDNVIPFTQASKLSDGEDGK